MTVEQQYIRQPQWRTLSKP